MARLTQTLNPFKPMQPELRSRLFGEGRAAGKGGQFAKGGGRVPAGTLYAGDAKQGGGSLGGARTAAAKRAPALLARMSPENQAAMVDLGNDYMRSEAARHRVTPKDADGNYLPTEVITTPERGITVVMAGASYAANGKLPFVQKMRDAAALEFSDAPGMGKYKSSGLDDPLVGPRRALLRARYEESQSILRQQGVTEVEVFRGVGSAHTSTSMGSWSTDRGIAEGYAKSGGGLTKSDPIVLSAKVPAAQVLGWGKEGLGLSADAEVVILGNPAAAENRAAGVAGEDRAKGGQFAKGGGRVPGSAKDVAAGLGSVASDSLNAELANRPRMVAEGTTAHDKGGLTRAGSQHPLSKEWAAESRQWGLDNSDKLPSNLKRDLVFAEGGVNNTGVRAAAKARSVEEIGKKMANDEDFKNELSRHLGAEVNLVPTGQLIADGNPMSEAVFAYAVRTPGGYQALTGTADRNVYELQKNHPNTKNPTVGEALDRLASHTGDTREGIAAKAYAQNTIDQWATTAGDSHLKAVSNQLSAGIVNKSPLSPLRAHVDPKVMEHAQIRLQGNDTFQRSYLKAEYAMTQDYFSKRGITEVTVTRGVVAPGLVRGTTIRVESNPLSSWSTNSGTASKFGPGSYGGSYGSGSGHVLQAKVPVSLIQSTAVTGRGCLNEYELLVIGSPVSEAFVVK